MNTSDPSSSLEARFDEFHALHPVADSVARKTLVRAIQGEIKRGEFAVTGDDVQKYLADVRELPRIFVYLLRENSRVHSSPEALRDSILSEWELLKRAELRPDASRMPLYYAVRTYLTRLKEAHTLPAAAANDRHLLREIETSLPASETDHDSSVHKRTAELRSLIEADSPDTASGHPTIEAARIARRATIFGAIIGALGVITVGLLANWQHLFRTSANQSIKAHVLTVTRVEPRDDPKVDGYRITININGQLHSYPTRSVWAPIGATQDIQIPLAPAAKYEIKMIAWAKRGEEYDTQPLTTSQSEPVLERDLIARRDYRYFFDPFTVKYQIE